MLIIFHATIGLLLSCAITLQQRMTGLSATFGGSGATFVQRRGAESVLFKATVWLSVVFFVLGVVQLFISQS
ncbi:MAG TPA: preprotein translocase subunit SecG [Candidatus Peribacterales bacterium]|nr:preprotein translocase subunit SecG [Candidatus Peribacterales bacterium]